MNIQNLLTSLNAQQLAAVSCTEGPLLVLAGAGTGKTKVLTTRIVNIIHQQLALPQNILAVTFTNKAAKEMRERVDNLINCTGIQIGTFHSIAARILRYSISALDTTLNSNFTIIDQEEQLKLIKDIATQYNIDTTIYIPKILQSTISNWKDRGLLPPDLLGENLQSSFKQTAKIIYIEYQRQLIAANVVDFGDLLLYNNEIFTKAPNLLNYYQNQYRYILIDEYQDTNLVQYLWAQMLSGRSKNICCVGDEDQSIYSWRGADADNIFRLTHDFPDINIIKLEQNYRSSTAILTAASGLISNNQNRYSKSLWTTGRTGEKIKIHYYFNEYDEAKFTVAEISKLISTNQYQANQIAILVRAGFQTRAFEEILISYLLPYTIIGGVKFYERMEVRDLLAYIRIALNNNDNIALERIINKPKRAIGNASLKQIKDYAVSNRMQLLPAIREMLKEGILSKKIQINLSKLVTQLDNWTRRYDIETAVEVTKSILEDSGYLNMLMQENTEEARMRIENINEMLSAIQEFPNIQAFIEHSSLVIAKDSLEASFGGAINVMTLHAAKGLEFDVVFLPGWDEGIFPHQRAIAESGNKGLEEERRIAYVGITRAKTLLYISSAKYRNIFGARSLQDPSRFLKEIPANVCVSQCMYFE